MTSVTVRVPGKLNLQLAVGPPRADGYHDLVTVFHAVSLFDEITAEPAARDGVTVSGEGADRVPADRDNLALRAVAALRAAVPAAPGVHITIAKRIPVAAGLAGGSGDAAAALVACNELWNARLAQPHLVEVAARVGSDVAFALLGGTAVGRGRGERLTPALAPATQYHWVLAFADGHLSTPEVYAALDRQRARAAGQGGQVPAQPELDAALMSALRSGDARLVGLALSNDLQPAALSLFPALRKTLAAGLELGALGALVAGSGRPACSWRPARTAPSTWPRRCPARASAGRWPGPAGRCPVRPSSARRGDRAAVNLISLEKAAKAYAHRTLLDEVSLGLSAGDRVGVVGRNGAGKSTLLALLAGRTAPDTGRVAMASGLRIGYLPQSDLLAGTVGEIVFGLGGLGGRPPERAGRPDGGYPLGGRPERARDHGRAAARDRRGRAGRAAVRRRAAAGGARRPAGGRARRAAARRAHQPPGHRGDRLARTPSA